MVDEDLPVARMGAEDHRRHAHLVDLRAAPLRDDLLEGLGDGFPHLRSRVVGAGGHRLALGGVEAAARRHDELDRVEETLVLRDGRIHHGGELRHDVAARVAEGRVRLDVGALVGAGEVDPQVAAFDGHPTMDVDVTLPVRVVIDVGVRFVDAVGPACDLLPEPSLGVRDDRPHGAVDRRRPEAREHLLQAADAELRRAHLRAEVAEKGRCAVVRRHHVLDVAALDALLEDLDRREAHALRPDVGRIHVVAPRGTAPGVGVMALDRGDQHALAVVEHGR